MEGHDRGYIGLDIISESSDYDFVSKFDEENDDSPYSNLLIDCKHLSEEKFIEMYGSKQQSKSLSFLSLNCQGLNSKFSEIKEFNNNLKSKGFSFDILFLQEIHQIKDSTVFNLHGYSELIFTQRIHRKKGGVGCFISSKLKFSIRKDLSMFEEGIFESQAIEVYSKKSKNIFINVYRPPSVEFNGISVRKQIETFQTCISNILQKISKEKNSKVYLVGDINLCLLKYESFAPTSKFIDDMFSAGFIELITKPTRISNNNNYTTATLIDHIWTNSVSNKPFDCGIITTQISDHFAIFSIIDFYKETDKQPKFIVTRDFSKENIDSFKSSLRSNLPHEALLGEEDAQVCYNKFEEIFVNLYDFHFPEKISKFNKNIHFKEKWMTRGLMKSRRTKLTLYEKSLKMPTLHNISFFKKYKNLYNKVTRARKQTYYSEMLLLHQGNIKKTWDIMREAADLPKRKSNLTDTLKIDNLLIEGEANLAECFNEHFSTITDKLRDKIPPSSIRPESYLSEKECNFNLPTVTPEMVIDEFKGLKIKHSTDNIGISTAFLASFIHEISAILSHIFNLSFRNGVFPTQFKLAKVVPISKGGDETNPNNYRPISLLPIFSKIHERIAASELKLFLLDNEIISCNQFGFQQNNSTFHPMMHLLDTVGDAINANEYTLAIFCDLSRAFDMVPIDLLLKKLESNGIRGTSLKWFESYLRDRVQYVKVGNSNSSYQNVKSGVPQGSVLGPILFLIFFNDLPCSTLLKVLLFADDTTLIASGKNLLELVNFVNHELKKISAWFRANQMVLHPDKTKFTIFHSKPSNIPWDDIKIFIDENENFTQDPGLKRPLSFVNHMSDVPAIKFLGLYFDPALNFKYHISQIHKKLSKALFILRRAKNVLTPRALKALYYSTFHCHLTYGNQIYSSADPGSLKGLKILQKKAIRCISNATYNAHTAPLFKKLNIMPLETSIKYNKLQMMYDFKTNCLPRSFDNKWHTVQHLTNRVSRNSMNFHIPYFRTKLVSRLPKWCIPDIWNSFETIEIKALTSRSQFNKKLKKQLLNELVIECNRQSYQECT